MENMILEIVEMDRKAREITDAAQAEKVSSEKEVAKRREEIRADYLERARKRIAQNEPVERETAEKEWAASAEKHRRQMQKLEALYLEKADEWVKTITERAVSEA